MGNNEPDGDLPLEVVFKLLEVVCSDDEQGMRELVAANIFTRTKLMRLRQIAKQCGATAVSAWLKQRINSLWLIHNYPLNIVPTREGALLPNNYIESGTTVISAGDYEFVTPPTRCELDTDSGVAMLASLLSPGGPYAKEEGANRLLPKLPLQVVAKLIPQLVACYAAYHSKQLLPVFNMLSRDEDTVTEALAKLEESDIHGKPLARAINALVDDSKHDCATEYHLGNMLHRLPIKAVVKLGLQGRITHTLALIYVCENAECKQVLKLLNDQRLAPESVYNAYHQISRYKDPVSLEALSIWAHGHRMTW